jgi:imidazole glycerol-phosphate synthase subunit HisH
MIAIIDYGLGNVFAFRNVYERLNIAVAIAQSPADVAGADKLILPGVGAFDHAMDKLDASGLREAVEEFALVRKRPILGVCVGMQMLTESSEEGARPGLGWLPGVVRKFEPGLDLPHMGWNDVNALRRNDLFRGMDDARFYFLHSYYVQCRDSADALAETLYGGEFCCAVNRDNIFGVQFHPEKSHHWGMRLLQNFAEL